MSDFETEIKKKINYTDQPCPICTNCAHHAEEEDKHVDRQWNSKCHIAGQLGAITVKPSGRCDKYKPG